MRIFADVWPFTAFGPLNDHSNRVRAWMSPTMSPKLRNSITIAKKFRSVSVLQQCTCVSWGPKRLQPVSPQGQLRFHCKICALCVSLTTTWYQKAPRVVFAIGTEPQRSTSAPYGLVYNYRFLHLCTRWMQTFRLFSFVHRTTKTQNGFVVPACLHQQWKGRRRYLRKEDLHRRTCSGRWNERSKRIFHSGYPAGRLTTRCRFWD